MGDTFTFQIKGEAVRLKPISDQGLEMLHTLHNMDAPGMKIYRGMMRILRDCMEPEQWDRLTDRVVEKEIGAEEVSDLMKRLTKKTMTVRKAATATADDAE